MRNIFPVFGAACSLALFSFCLAGQSYGQTPRISAEIAQILKSGCDYHSSIDNYQMELYDMIDDVNDAGQKIQYGHHRVVTVSQPDQFYSFSEGDRTSRKTWKDKEKVTFLDFKEDKYATFPFEGTNGELLDYLIEDFDVSIPLADLLGGGIYDHFTENVLNGTNVGISHVNGVECHHLAFHQENIDWQIWIETDNTPLIRKLVITYTESPESPQYMMILKDLMVMDKVDGVVFEAKVPEAATAVTLVPVAGENDIDDVDGDETKKGEM